MKFVLFSLLLITVSCGKDNKSGNLAVPQLAEPLLPQRPILAGNLIDHWVESKGCYDQLNRPNGMKTRFEIRFKQSNQLHNGLPVGEVQIGDFEYSNRCIKGYEREIPPTSYYLLGSDILKISENPHGPFRPVRLRIIGDNKMDFDDRQLVRLKLFRRR